MPISSYRRYASIAAMLFTCAIAAPALARTSPASAGRAQLGTDEASFNAPEAFVTNVSSTNKLWTMPLIFDSPGSKTIVVYGSVQSGGFMQCRAVTRNTSNIVASSSSSLIFPTSGVTTSVTLSLSSVPAGSVGVVHCVMSGSSTAILFGIGY